MHPCPGNFVAIGLVFVYFAWVAHQFNARIKCQYCTQVLIHVEISFIKTKSTTKYQTSNRLYIHESYIVMCNNNNKGFLGKWCPLYNTLRDF